MLHRPVSRRRRTRLIGAAALVSGVAWLSPPGCSSSRDGERADPHYLVDDDGGIRLNLAHKDVRPIFEQPRRYPFTVAVAPLYVDWADGSRIAGESTVHQETLNTPIPGDDPRLHEQALRWPPGSDSPEEELLILQATRAGFDERAAEESARKDTHAEPQGPPVAPGVPVPPADETPPVDETPPADAQTPPVDETPADTQTPPIDETPPPDAQASPVDEMPGDAEAPATEAPETEAPAPETEAPAPETEAPETEAPAPETEAPAADDAPPTPAPERRLRRVSQRLQRWLQATAACPPDEPTSSADAAAASTFTYAAPAGWVEAEPTRPRKRLVASHASPDGTARVIAEWSPRADLLPRGQALDTTDAAPWAERLRAFLPEVGALEAPGWTELDGAPALEARATSADGASLVWVVFTEDRVFTLELSAPDAAGLDALAAQVRTSARVDGRPVAAAPEPAAAAPAPPSTDRSAAERAREEEIDALDGKNFAIRETGFQDRFAALLEQFGVFERVEKLQFVTDSQRRDPTQLFSQADSRGADLMIVAKLRRNKVSYTGFNARYIGDLALWIAFWWPSEIWPGVRSEEYRSDVELVLEIYDVRSRAKLWDTTYRADETMALSAPERGWIPWGPVLVNLFGLRTDGLYAGAGTYVRPRAWLEVEYQILRDLWSTEGFKGVIDTRIRPTFEDRVNVGVEPRRQALVVGIGRYGPAAAPVLALADRERGRTLERVRRDYGDDSLSLGMRPYAETDAQRLREFLVNEAGFGSGDVRLLVGARATRVQIKAALRQLAKARRPDPVVLYLNGQVVVVDDPRAPGDELRKYFLPYDADLQTLERLRAIPDPDERANALRAHLDKTAISFDWITATFNQEDIQDHRYLMSREVMLVFDAEIPGVLGLRYAPRHAAQVAAGWQPTASGGGAATTAPGGGTQPPPPDTGGTGDTRSPPIDETTPEQAPSEPTEQAPTEPTPTEPTPTEPTPTEPAPAEPTPTEPAPAEPTPTEPTPTEPAPAEPTPTEPTPTEPAPAEPTPAEPAPAEPTPTEPAPAEATPAEPAPAEPAPAEPAPTEPAPAEPAPAEPAPAEPAPAEPTPTEPAPAEPTPAEPAPAEPTPAEPAPAEQPPRPVPVPDPTPAEPPPASTEPAPPERPRLRRVSQGRITATTLPAQAEGPGRPAAAPEARLTDDFLQVLARPGRKVIVTARFNEALLDVVPQRAGGFMYHFLRGARDRSRVPARYEGEGDERVMLVELAPVLDYTRSRVEDESRTLNQPQSILSLGDNDDFPLIRRGQ